MKKSIIWIVGGIVLIALIVGGYFYFKASADVVSGTSTGSTNVTLKMDTTYNDTVYNKDVTAIISVTNNTNKPIQYMKVYIPQDNPSFIYANYKNSALASSSKTSANIIGLKGYSVDATSGAVITNDSSVYPTTSKDITTLTSGGYIYKVFPVVGYKVNNTTKVAPAIPAKATYTLRVFFKKNITNSVPVTVSIDVKTPDPSTPEEWILITKITKTTTANEKSIKLYVPSKITGSKKYAILNYDNKQDIAVPIVSDQIAYRSSIYDTKSLSTVMAGTTPVEVPSSLVATVGDYIAIPVYPMSTVPAMTNGAKYEVLVDYIETNGSSECSTVSINEDTNYGVYGGAGACLGIGDYPSSKLSSPNLLDSISSVTVASGYKVILYEGDNFTGNSLELTTNVADLRTKNFNDVTSSLKVVKIEDTTACGTVEVFDLFDYNITGVHACLPLGAYTTAELVAKGIPNDTISSVKVASGYQLTIYKDDNFAGDRFVLGEGPTGLIAFNNTTSSLKVELAATN